MSQADATSLEGEAPATTGCYRQYEHAIGNPPQLPPDARQVRPAAAPGASNPSNRTYILTYVITFTLVAEALIFFYANFQYTRKLNS